LLEEVALNHRSSLFALLFGSALSLVAGAARADIVSDCGGAVFNGDEQCTAEVKGTCDLACSTPNLQLACNAQLEASCQGGCNATLPSCQASCQGGCDAKCQVNPGTYDCKTDCSATCEGNCTGACSTASDHATCEGQCQASCAARCTTQCSGQPPTADCQGQCALSCQGSCDGQANLSCDIDCQARGSASCTASLQEKCVGDCNLKKPQIYCNGSFINAADANACADDLRALFHITVTGWSYSDSGCDGGTCSADAAAGGSVSCALSPTKEPPLSGGIFGIALGAVVVGAVRRRQKRPS